MKKILLLLATAALMIFATIALTGCKKEPEIMEDRSLTTNKQVDCECDCGEVYKVTRVSGLVPAATDPRDDYFTALGSGANWKLTLNGNSPYPFVAYKAELDNDDGYCFWKCKKCGRYHRYTNFSLNHAVILSGEQPEEWNKYNHLWQ